MFTVKTVVLAIATFTAAVSAAPNGGPSVAMAAQQCGSQKMISCCNSKDTQAGGLLGGLDVLGGNCSPLDVGLIANVPIKSACKDVAACCSGDQTGLINIACTPITL